MLGVGRQVEVCREVNSALSGPISDELKSNYINSSFRISYSIS